MEEDRFTIMFRTRRVINTDPQRRCYNGCHKKWGYRWTDWESLESNIDSDTVERRLKFWNELNDYAVSQRGESARRELKVIEYDANCSG